MTDNADLPEHVRRNRAWWDAQAADYVAAGERYYSRDAAVVEKLAAAGLQLTPVMGAAFEKAVVDEIAQWKSIIAAEGIVDE